jgi:hypothetical protein
MSSKIYPIDDVKQIERSRARIKELEFIISDIYKQKGWVNWCLSIDRSVIYNLRIEMKKEQEKIDEIIDN